MALFSLPSLTVASALLSCAFALAQSARYFGDDTGFAYYDSDARTQATLVLLNTHAKPVSFAFYDDNRARSWSAAAPRGVSVHQLPPLKARKVLQPVAEFAPNTPTHTWSPLALHAGRGANLLRQFAEKLKKNPLLASSSAGELMLFAQLGAISATAPQLARMLIPGTQAFAFRDTAQNGGWLLALIAWTPRASDSVLVFKNRTVSRDSQGRVRGISSFQKKGFGTRLDYCAVAKIPSPGFAYTLTRLQELSFHSFHNSKDNGYYFISGRRPQPGHVHCTLRFWHDLDPKNPDAAFSKRLHGDGGWAAGTGLPERYYALDLPLNQGLLYRTVDVFVHPNWQLTNHRVKKGELVGFALPGMASSHYWAWPPHISYAVLTKDSGHATPDLQFALTRTPQFVTIPEWAKPVPARSIRLLVWGTAHF